MSGDSFYLNIIMLPSILEFIKSLSNKEITSARRFSRISASDKEIGSNELFVALFSMKFSAPRISTREELSEH